jgi:hypothetical protein
MIHPYGPIGDDHDHYTGFFSWCALFKYELIDQSKNLDS